MTIARLSVSIYKLNFSYKHRAHNITSMNFPCRLAISYPYILPIDNNMLQNKLSIPTNVPGKVVCSSIFLIFTNYPIKCFSGFTTENSCSRCHPVCNFHFYGYLQVLFGTCFWCIFLRHVVSDYALNLFKRGKSMKFGIIGGSGLYEIEGLTDIEKIKVSTPFGEPSDDYIAGKLEGKDIVFLPRHGRGHRFLPSEINYRANIWGMKSLDVTHLISVSAVGSLKMEIVPGHIVLPDQFIDRTKDRPSTFFGNGLVAHLQFGNPTCSYLSTAIAASAKNLDITCHESGTYICMEGPMFSTRAESEMYRSFGASVIGMTNLQEAKLAREAELCFATIALATDYDCWHESEEEVSVDAILEVMRKNVENTKAILKGLVREFLPKSPACQDQNSLQGAILTPIETIPEQVKTDLNIIIGKYL